MKKKSLKSLIWIIAPGLLFTLLVGLPLLAILLEGVGPNLPGYLGDEQARAALRVSLVSSSFSTAAAILLGTPLAYALARTSFRGQSLVELLVDLPIVLPPSVAGLGLLLAFGRRGLLGGGLQMLGITLPFTTVAVVLAQLFVSGPLYVRAARIGFNAVQGQLVEAAVTEGATHWHIFRHVMVPVALPALISGALLSWARAIGEFGATILFAGNLIGRTQTIPLAIYVGLEGNPEVAIALSLLLLGVSAIFLTLLRRLERAWSTV